MTPLKTGIALAALSHSAAYAAVLHYSKTANGFTSQPKGWNSFALTAVGQLEFNQDNVIEQCDSMASSLGSQGYQYCSLDSGWSVGANGDEYGRIIYDEANGWDIPALADHLHGNGMLLGIYVGSPRVYYLAILTAIRSSQASFTMMLKSISMAPTPPSSCPPSAMGTATSMHAVNSISAHQGFKSIAIRTLISLQNGK